jgi:hypothetical protein
MPVTLQVIFALMDVCSRSTGGQGSQRGGGFRESRRQDKDASSGTAWHDHVRVTLVGTLRQAIVCVACTARAQRQVRHVSDI